MCRILRVISACLLGLAFWCAGLSEKVQAEIKVEKEAAYGGYLSQTAGCNDCHTSGYLLSDGKVPERLWLTGSAFGWRGPWGTTYATNLRLFLQQFTQSQWIAFAKGFKAKPPMPWFDVNIMTDNDLRALYDYIKYLGPRGEPAPAYLPPDKEPKTPYALFPSPPK